MVRPSLRLAAQRVLFAEICPAEARAEMGGAIGWLRSNGGARMNAITQPSAFEKAQDRVTDLLRALDLMRLGDAIKIAREINGILETEQHFREAKKVGG